MSVCKGACVQRHLRVRASACERGFCVKVIYVEKRLCVKVSVGKNACVKVSDVEVFFCFSSMVILKP